MDFEITPELEEKIKSAESLEAVVEILKAEGLDVTMEDMKKAASSEQCGELSEDDLEDVSGGAINWRKILLTIRYAYSIYNTTRRR